MSTMRELINRGSRWPGVRDRSRTLDAQPADDYLEDLQAFYLGVIDEVALAGLTPVLIDDDYEAGEDELVQFNGTPSATVTLPTTVTDADTGETRAPRDGAIVMVAGDPTQTFVYESYRGDWTQIESLTLDSYAPFSAVRSQGLAAIVAEFVAQESGIVNPAAALASQARSFLKARLRKRVVVPVDAALLRASPSYC